MIIGGNGKFGAPVPLISDDTRYNKYQFLAENSIKAVKNDTKIIFVALVFATRNMFLLKNDFDISDLQTSTMFEAAYIGLEKSITELISNNKKVILLIDNPTLSYPQDCINRRTDLNFLNEIFYPNGLEHLSYSTLKCEIAISQHLKYSQKYRDILQTLASKYNGSIILVDSIPILCDQKLGICSHYKNGRLLYSMSDHINDYAARLIGEKINSEISKFFIHN